MNDDGYFGCKILSLKTIMTLFKEVLVPANFVPAAAVIREGQALFGIIGRKGFVDCNVSCIQNIKKCLINMQYCFT